MIPDFPIDIRISLAELNFFLLLPDFANFLPCWLVSAKLTQLTGQKISKVRKQQKKFQFCQSYSYVNRKVWYHQIWIPNNLGYMVLILMNRSRILEDTFWIIVICISEIIGTHYGANRGKEKWSVISRNWVIHFVKRMSCLVDVQSNYAYWVSIIELQNSLYTLNERVNQLFSISY